MDRYKNTSITLFSSDSTVKYTKDVFNVLALPQNGIYQFRYEDKYVETSVKDKFRNDYKGLWALVAFRSNSSVPEDERFFVPVRWVEIVAIDYVANFYTVTFRAKEYPKFSNDFDEKCHDFAKEFFSTTREHNLLAVREGTLAIVDSNFKGDDKDNWLKIAKTISLIPGYGNNYFLKCSPIYINQNKFCNIENELTVLEEGKYVYLKVDYYQKNYNSQMSGKINIITDSNAINVASGIGTELESRYDSVKLGFQAKKVMNNSISEINIHTTNNNSSNVQTKIIIPIKIVKNRKSKFVESLFMGIGAFCVGLPGILETSVGVGTKVVVSLLGVLILGVNNYIETKG